MKYSLPIMLAILPAQPAFAETLRADGVVVASCETPNCGGWVVRAPPWVIKGIKKLEGRSDADVDPYLPLSVVEQEDLTKFSRLLLSPTITAAQKNTLAQVSVTYFYDREPTTHRKSSSEEFRTAFASLACKSTNHSLSVDGDAEKYAVLNVRCGPDGSRGDVLIGVAIKAGKVSRMYFGYPQSIYHDVGSLKKANSGG